MFETEAEYTEEISIVSTAIRNLIRTGQEYEIGSGNSRRTFEHADIDKLIKYRNSLNMELKTFNGVSGMQVGF